MDEEMVIKGIKCCRRVAEFPMICLTDCPYHLEGKLDYPDCVHSKLMPDILQYIQRLKGVDKDGNR